MVINYDYATIIVNGQDVGLVRFTDSSMDYSAYYDDIATIKRPNDRRVVFMHSKGLAVQDNDLQNFLKEILTQSDNANWRLKQLHF